VSHLADVQEAFIARGEHDWRMSDQASSVRLQDLRSWAIQPTTWLQVARFLGAGAAGYLVNLVVYGACLHFAHLDYRLAAVAAFAVALTTTFVLNRRYTFAAHGTRPGRQARRYLVVSVLAFLTSVAVLQALVEWASLAKLVSQALAVGVAAPVNYAGQRLWAFEPQR
jgi:putative flippase GtrA